MFIIFVLLTAGFFAVSYQYLADTRQFLSRSVAYVLSLFCLTILYVGIGVLVSATLLPAGSQVSREAQVFNVGLALLMAMLYQPLKEFFDQKTERLFYRTNYSTEEVLDELNKLLASHTDLQVILDKVSKFLVGTMGIEACSIAVHASRSGQWVQSDAGPKLKNTQLEQLTRAASKQSLVEPADTTRVVAGLMNDQSWQIIASLSSNNGQNKTSVGFMAFGGKMNGANLNIKDLRLIEIVADELALAVQNALRFKEITDFSATMQSKVDSATKQLRTKNAKLRELDQAKDDFISMASHQLRTPLTSIKGYLSMLNEGDFGKMSKNQQDIIELAYESSERMVYLIADLLNVSRINTGRFVIEVSEVDLGELIKQEAKQLERTAKTKGLKLKIKIPKRVPVVLLDETKTRQVIMNLIDNALYYTNQGEVEVRLKSGKDALEFTVTDTGIGVPESAQADLFTKFYRAENARRARPDGTGLGLFMAKKVVSAQGGSVIFSSKEGEGSTFGFRFSLAAIAAKKSKK